MTQAVDIARLVSFDFEDASGAESYIRRPETVPLPPYAESLSSL